MFVFNIFFPRVSINYYLFVSIFIYFLVQAFTKHSMFFFLIEFFLSLWRYFTYICVVYFVQRRLSSCLIYAYVYKVQYISPGAKKFNGGKVP